MKIAIYLILILQFFLLSCKKDQITNETPQEIIQTVTNGTWTISYFLDKQDETSNFTGYSFTFEKSGTLSAVNGSQSYMGTWSSFTDDSTLKLNIFFSSPESFQDLSDDWHVIERSDNLVRLEDISGGDGSIQYLNFSKK